MTTCEAAVMDIVLLINAPEQYVESYTRKVLGEDIGFQRAVEAVWREIDPRAIEYMTGLVGIRPRTRVNGVPKRWQLGEIVFCDALGAEYTLCAQTMVDSLSSNARSHCT